MIVLSGQCFAEISGVRTFSCGLEIWVWGTLIELWAVKILVEVFKLVFCIWRSFQYVANYSQVPAVLKPIYNTLEFWKRQGGR